MPLISFSAFYIYTNANFLNNKINHQIEESQSMGVNSNSEYLNTRFGSLLFDLHYIIKHPLTGNGLHEKTRYADHPFLIREVEKGANLGNGNGLSNALASMGIPFVIAFFVLTFMALKTQTINLVIVCMLLSLFFNLLGEEWMFTPLYLGFPFLYLALKKTLMNQIKFEYVNSLQVASRS